MAIEITWEDRGVYRRFFDCVTSSDLHQSVVQVHHDPRFDALRYSLNDFLEAASVDVHKVAVEGAAARAMGKSLSKRNLVTAFVANDPEVIAFVKVYMSPDLESFPTRLFGTISEAREWIDASLQSG